MLGKIFYLCPRWEHARNIFCQGRNMLGTFFVQGRNMLGTFFVQGRNMLGTFSTFVQSGNMLGTFSTFVQGALFIFLCCQEMMNVGDAVGNVC